MSSIRGIFFVVAVAWSAAFLLRWAVVDDHYQQRLAQRPDEDVLRSPGPAVLQVVSMQHPLAWGDLTWLAIVQEIGRAMDVNAAGWDRVERWSEIATDLDPRYFTVYHSAGVNLSVHAKRPEASDRLLLKGLTALPSRWELAMLLGYNAYFLRGDAVLASDYMAQAAAMPGSPRWVGALSGRMRFHGGDELGAIDLLESMLHTLEGPAREDVEQRILILKSEPRLRLYDEACKGLLAETGQRPDPDTLFREGKVAEPPVDLLGFPVEFDDKCVARTKVIHVREFEAKKRVGGEARRQG